MGKTDTNQQTGIGGKVLRGVADLIKLLPSGTMFVFQFLTPLLTNAGHCSMTNKVLSGILLLVCGFSCCFSSFTDSYVGVDGKLYYGLVTTKGLLSFSDPNSSSIDLSKYKLRIGDFVHAFLSLAVFAVVAVLDTDTVSCLYPALLLQQKTLIMILPTIVGALVSGVFVVFPNNRHGIGYQPTQATEDFTHEQELELN